MANRKEERKGSALTTAVIGAAGLAAGWAAMELGFGGVLKPGREAVDRSLQPKEVDMEDDPAVLLVDEAPSEAKVKDESTEVTESTESTESTKPAGEKEAVLDAIDQKDLNLHLN